MLTFQSFAQIDDLLALTSKLSSSLRNLRQLDLAATVSSEPDHRLNQRARRALEQVQRLSFRLNSEITQFLTGAHQQTVDRQEGSD